ncbi:MAG: ABC transporter permease [Clostridiales bacterium]|nr:ABC transporter permease [Clostridiales bacterium]
MIGLVTIIVLFLFAFLGPVFYNQWGEIEIDLSIPEEKREVVKTETYNERIDASLLFVDGKVSNDESKLLPGVVFDGYSEAGNRYGHYTDAATGEPVYFMLQTGSSAAAYVSDEYGTKIPYTYAEYTWDRKTFNEKGKISANHWLGTDEYGMDVFVRLMYGGRISLTLGFVVVFLETFLGILFGGLAGYFGKWVDQLIMRIVDIFGCVPQFPILLILGAVLEDADINQRYQIYYLMIIMTVLGWTGVARVVRGQILFLREQEYMVAAEALGLSTTRKIVRHLVPNIMPQLIVQMTLGLGGIILTESTLSYLGIGIPKPYAAWGTMISAAQKPEILQYYPNLWIPAGILIVLAVLGFNFIGDGLRDAFDPKASR